MRIGKDTLYASYIKRIFGFSISLTALLGLSPLLVLLTAAGTIVMRGNPFFVQERPGRIDPKTGRERIFSLIKFRTMTNEKDADGNLLPDDVRLNRYGKFLRKTSLDELPELVNIVLGDMAIVGPRPLLVEYLALYSEKQRHRHDVRPGLTGYAQAHGRNALSWEDRFAMDVWYTKNISLKLDAQILVDTVKTVLKRDGISSATSDTMEKFTGSAEHSETAWEAPV